ncbi:substrate-binding domain-containing protein [Tsukamurella asaccharolytica]|uniref:Substrate-binding domain-containing protein n=1 Tax=Tsukamurella asaccharolytica TaxID=2592067 RepID=A0A5C5R756_9ACTN|nr:substrate-binding domain-containing protein [Tsukamurella asaccharolytica]TWS18658.1 substrate-binding domain-containing protein [Tsukamurella asaccharolytica]
MTGLLSRRTMLIATAGSLVAAVAACSDQSATPGTSSGGASRAAGGTIAIITVNPSNPYWKAEVDTAVREATRLGYKTTTSAHNNKPDLQTQQVETAINDKVAGIILDPAGADESVAIVQKIVDAKIPVVLVNAEISQQGLARAQIVSNNAQGATAGAEAWAEKMGYKGSYVELLGKPSDKNAQVRSDAYAAVLSQYPDLKKLGAEIANWDRQEGQAKMEALLAKNPDLNGVIAGNDEMALGAINALKSAGKLAQVKVLGFDGNQDAVEAVKKDEMVATVVQPIVKGTTLAIEELNRAITNTGSAPAQEKQALECVLVTKENADKVNNFEVRP